MESNTADRSPIEKGLIPVLVTTEWRGVFFGYTENPDPVGENRIVKLQKARNCVRWSGTKGFLGLATTGPNEKCRIGPVAEEFTAIRVTGVAKMTPEAVQKWEAAPWSNT